jgi:hypothetical protein
MADRTVTTRLKLAVTDFVAGGNTAKRTLRDLDRKFSESAGFAQGFRKQLEDAAKRLPPIDIDVNSSAADIKIAEIRSRLESLSSKTVGVDVDAADAYAELQALQRELETIDGDDVSFEVRAGVAQAIADLQVIDHELNQVDGRTAHASVNVDAGGSLATIAMIGAALAALPAVTTIAVGATALGAGFTAAGVGVAGFAAVAVPSLGRINTALAAQASAADQAGAATGGAGKSAAQAAQQAMQLEQAEKRLKDAQAERRQAQEDLTRATEDGRRALEDLNFSLERSILSQKDSALAVREAEARLTELRAKGDASDLELERAMLSVDMAHQRAREQETKTQRAKKDTAEANKAGVKGTAEYQKGLDKLTAAEAKVSQATDQLKQLQLQQNAAMSGGGGAAAQLKDALGDLSKEEKTLAKDVKAFSDEYLAWQRSLQPEVFPAIHQGLDLMRLGLRETTPLAKSGGVALLQLGKDAEAALRGPFWQSFLYDLNTAIPGGLTSLGRIGINTFTGFAGIIRELLPYGLQLLGNVEDLSAEFADWGTTLDQNPAFQKFLADVKENAPEVWELIKNLVAALLNIGEAVAPLGLGAFSGLGALAEIVAGMDPGRIQTIALALGAIKLASMGLSAVSAWQNLAGGVTAVGGAAGKTGSKMAALGKATIGLGVAVVGLEATGSLIAHLEGQSAGIDKLTLSLTELGQTGKWAGDLERQWAGALGDSQAAVEGFRNDLAALEDPGWYERIFLHPFTELGALLPGIDSSVDRIEQRFTDLDTALAGMVTNGNADQAAKAFEQFAKQAEAQGIPVDKLRALLPLYGQAVRVAGNASAEAAAQIDQTKVRMDALQGSLDTFAGKTDALQAMQNLKGAYEQTGQAIEAASGKLEINTRMTDEQKDAVIRARTAFSDLITQVKTAADAQASMTGRTSEARDAVLQQLPELMKLAGSNKEAKEQVLALAGAYGISEGDARKAAKGGQDLIEVIAKIKSKDIHIGADVRPAQEAIDNFITLNSGRKIPLHVYTKNSQLAAGAIMRYASGGVADPIRMASGGRASPSPHIAEQSTILYGEGRAPEAFIPYDMAMRSRAEDLVARVASDFGGRFTPQGSGGGTSQYMTASHLGGGTNTARVSSPQTAGWRPASAPAHTPATGNAGGGPAQQSHGGVNVPITMNGVTVREDADIDKIGSKIGFKIMGSGLT